MEKLKNALGKLTIYNDCTPIKMGERKASRQTRRKVGRREEGEDSFSIGLSCRQAGKAINIHRILARAQKNHPSLSLDHEPEYRSHQFHLASRKKAKALQEMGSMPRLLEQGVDSRLSFLHHASTVLVPPA